MSENDIGPQKGPASTARIEAQAKAIRNELEQLPKIRPLVWVQTGTRHRIAITPMGAFEVWKCVGEEAWKGFFQGQQEYKFCSEEDAKAACQSEYERRVRECLE